MAPAGHLLLRVVVCAVAAWSTASAQSLRKVGEMELPIVGLSATADPGNLVVPKNTPAGVRVTVQGGLGTLSLADVRRFFGPEVSVQGELAGPGLTEVIRLSSAGSADPLLLPTPALPRSGNFQLANLRLVADGRAVLDIAPGTLNIEAIEQILVTSVTTRPLTLAEIRAKGIVLDRDDYLGFEFTMAVLLESRPVQLKFPVIFDRLGMALPEFTRISATAPHPELDIPSLPTIIPAMLKIEGVTGPQALGTLPGGELVEVRIPSVLVIPGNVGFLKQFFSAQLFVANGAPGTSGLSVRDVRGTVTLPAGPDHVPGNADDPLSLPQTTEGPAPATLPILGAGADGIAGTSDDLGTLGPGEQGMAEFLVRGETEGFHALEFEIDAVLDGLKTGPAKVTGTARGAVLVRNPYFDVTFAVPSVVRRNEPFKLFATVTNKGQGLGNDISVTLDASRLSGARLAGDATMRIDTLRGGDAQTLQFDLVSDRTGQVVASYLRFDTETGVSGDIRFTLGVDERGVALSPDTLVLPAPLDGLPSDVIETAMRVLGQAWSIGNAPPGTLPAGVLRVTRTTATAKALALAEAGLRISFGQPPADSVRDLVADFHGASQASLRSSIDAGFDQLLRSTEAGRDFARAAGLALADAVGAAGGAMAYQHEWARLLASGPDHLTLAMSGGYADAVLIDRTGRRLDVVVAEGSLSRSELPGGVALPLGGEPAAAGLAYVAALSGSPYTLEVTGRDAGIADLAVALPAGDGTSVRAVVSVPVQAGSLARVILDLRTPSALTLEQDLDADGVIDSVYPFVIGSIVPEGPRMLSAAIVGPETFPTAAPFGLHVALMFDRAVDAASATDVSRFDVPDNQFVVLRRALSGRFVLGQLAWPEGPYVPTTVRAGSVADLRGATREAIELPLQSRLVDPGAVVTGRVFAAGGAPAGGVDLYYIQNLATETCLLSASPRPLLKLTTSADGRFGLRYVRQDQCGQPFSLVAQDPVDGATRSVERRVRAAGEQIVADLVLFGRGGVTGVVRDATGQPVGGAHVSAISSNDTGAVRQALTDGEGRYTLSDLVVGPVSVRAYAVRNGVTALQGTGAGRIARAGTSATIDVTLESGTASISGTVRYVTQGESGIAAGARVLFRVRSAGAPGGDFRLTAGQLTDAEGRFSFAGMPAGSFRLEITLNTSARTTAVRTGLALDGDVLTDQDVVVEVPVTASIRGRVRRADDSAVAGALVSLGDSGAMTDAEGRFELQHVPVRPTQSQSIRAHTADGRTGTVSVLVSQPGVVENVTITLSALGRAEFTVWDAFGAPIPNLDVALLADGFGLAGACSAGCGCAQAVRRTDANGRVTFDNVPAGRATARATRIQAGFVEVVEGHALVADEGLTGIGLLRFGGSGALAGVVLDPGGQPVHGADISVRSRQYDGGSCSMVDNTISHVIRTDTDGRFRLGTVAVGLVTVTARHFIYNTQVGAQLSIARAGDERQVSLRLVDTVSGELSGRVLLPDGSTPAGAGVEVTATGPLPDVVVRTNDQGEFRFAKIFPQGSYLLTARDPITGGVASERIYLRAGQDDVHDLRLKGRGTVTVRVVDALDNPVERAVVRLQETEYPKQRFEGIADAANQGLVTFDRVFEGPVVIDASDAHARGGRTSAVVPAPDAAITVKVRMTVTGTVRGRFLAADGVTPVPYGVIRLLAGGRRIGEATTGGTAEGEGTFEFLYVPAGAVRIEAFDPVTGRTGVAAGTIYVEGDDLQLDVRAQGLGTVTGVVTAGGVPQPGAHVDVVAGAFRVGMNADAGGHYTIDGVPEGLVSITAAVAGGIQKGQASGTLSGDGATLTLDVAVRDVGGLTGVVTTAAGGVPLPTIVVASAAGFSFSATTDEDGAFTFERLPAGRVTLQADVLGSIDRGRLDVEVAGSSVTTVTVPLNGVGAISGRAFDAFGTPTAGTVVLRGTGPASFTLSMTLGPDGLFDLPEVLAGPFTVTLERRDGSIRLFGSAAGTVVADAPPAAVEVRLQDTATVTGVVVRAGTSTPAAGADVRVSVSDGSQVLVPVFADGRFTARGIPLGPFSVLVTDTFTGGAALVRDQVATTNGEVVDLGTIVLDDGPVMVSSVQPADGSVDVALGEPVVITFSDPLQSPAGIVVRDGSSAVNVTRNLSPDGLTVTMTPSSGAWPETADLEVLVPTSLTDIYGRHPAQAFSSRFRTVDLSPPSVTSTSPANGGVQVAVAVDTLFVTFSEPLVEGNLPTIGVSGPSGELTGSASRVAPDTFTFGPLQLASNSAYIVTVANAVDRGGNAQVQPYVGRFQTVDTLPPSLELIGPALLTTRRPTIDVRVIDNLGGDFSTVSADLGGRTLIATQVGESTLRLQPLLDVPDGIYTLSVSMADFGGLVAALTVDMTVEVPPTGTLRGRVFAADGTTPRPGSTVLLTGAVSSSKVTGADAIFEFSDIPLGSYTLKVWDGRTLALSAVTLSVSGETVTHDLVLIPRGTVTGTVTQPNGAPAGGTVSVTLQSFNAQVPGQQHTWVNNGQYTFFDVPSGTFSIVAADVLQPWRAEATGTLTSDGQVVTVNLQLVNNTVALPRTVFDGNNMRFDVQRAGTLLDGQSDAFDTGLQLKITPAGGVEQSFTGATTGLIENGGREVAVSQNGLAGLNITRKIFVPANGYFGRYLELLTNPGTSPLTVSVRILSNLGSNTATTVVATSSGDTQFAADDRWIVTDDTAPASGDPTVGHVFGGAGASVGVSAASLSSDNLSFTWNSLTIEPGQTVALMHFAVQIWGHAQVTAAAERLVQLPPEALEGLDPGKIPAVLNFAVPPTGVSDLEPLALGGTVTGRVLGADGVTPVPNAQVTFVTSTPMFARNITVTTTTSGTFTIAQNVTAFGQTVMVPVAPFTLTATRLGIVSPVATGDFEEGTVTATRDLVFSNAGIIQGRVLRHTGEPLAGGGVISIATGGSGSSSILTDGSYVFPVVKPATVTLSATSSFPSGIPLTGQVTTSVGAGEVREADIVLVATGTVAGTVRGFNGEPISWSVTLRVGFNNTRTVTSNTAGQYVFNDVPVGAYTVQTAEGGSGALHSFAIAVAADQVTVQDFQFTGSGTLNGTVRFGTGAPAPGVLVSLLDQSTFRGQLVSTGAGAYSFTNVAAGRPMTLQVSSPIDGSTRDHIVTIPGNGQTVTTDIYVPALATVRVIVKTPDGSTVSGSEVLLRQGSQFYSFRGVTDASGMLDITNIPEGPFDIRATDPARLRADGLTPAAVQLADHAGVVTVPVTLPFLGTVRGHVFAGDGQTPLANVSVQIRRLDGAVVTFLNTNNQGVYETTLSVLENSFRVIATVPNDQATAEQQGTFTSDGEIVDIDLTLPVTVLAGRVTFATGEPVTNGTVVVVQNESAPVTTYIESDGSYRLLNVVAGETTVTAQDYSSGLSGSVTTTIPDGTWATRLDVTLQPSGTVTGTVRDASGQPVPFAWVQLLSSGLAYWRGTGTDAAGVYRIERVAVGTIAATAIKDVSATATGILADDGATLTLDIILPPTVALTGTVFTAEGLPVASTTVVLFEDNESGQQGGRTVLADASGTYTSIVKEGSVRVIARSGTATGVTDTLVGPTGGAADVTLGNALDAWSRPVLSGSAGLRYVPYCNGELEQGGTADNRLWSPYATTYRLTINGLNLTCRQAFLLELDSRQIVVGPLYAGPMIGTRRLFVPPSGRFVRYLDSITNPGDQPVTVTVRISGETAWSQPTVLKAPSAAETFALTHQNWQPASYPILAHVFASPDAPAVPAVSFAAGDSNISYLWTLTLQPGETVNLLHFAAQNEPNDPAGAEALARELMWLTEPDALFGLTAEDLQRIRNFVVQR